MATLRELFKLISHILTVLIIYVIKINYFMYINIVCKDG